VVSLSLRNQRMSEPLSEVMPHVRALARWGLRSLNLEGNHLSGDLAPLAAAVEDLTHLTSLSLGDNRERHMTAAGRGRHVLSRVCAGRCSTGGKPQGLAATQHCLHLALTLHQGRCDPSQRLLHQRGAVPHLRSRPRPHAPPCARSNPSAPGPRSPHGHNPGCPG
jgi:hypothetical protein